VILSARIELPKHGPVVLEPHASEITWKCEAGEFPVCVSNSLRQLTLAALELQAGAIARTLEGACVIAWTLEGGEE